MCLLQDMIKRWCCAETSVFANELKTEHFCIVCLDPGQPLSCELESMVPSSACHQAVLSLLVSGTHTADAAMPALPHATLTQSTTA